MAICPIVSMLCRVFLPLLAHCIIFGRPSFCHGLLHLAGWRFVDPSSPWITLVQVVLSWFKCSWVFSWTLFDHFETWNMEIRIGSFRESDAESFSPGGYLVYLESEELAMFR
eukprot:TRINITY_DN7214_c0_g1_i4.p1 TRINITY_DN7214_c0_g1~~TRINITY_DN7214_c0_g1_i4.p1  ORF type:complete len:112 (+),score=9.19 TRINITY_DN7214_c0_g1_i4:1970-2305(+)